jgi:hypothetical protein
MSNSYDDALYNVVDLIPNILLKDSIYTIFNFDDLREWNV